MYGVAARVMRLPVSAAVMITLFMAFPFYEVDLFSTGAVRFSDQVGNPYYHDSAHLSAVGAALVKADLIEAMVKRRPALSVLR